MLYTIPGRLVRAVTAAAAMLLQQLPAPMALSQEQVAVVVAAVGPAVNLVLDTMAPAAAMGLTARFALPGFANRLIYIARRCSIIGRR